MKFLSQNMEGKNLMPIHVYYTRGDFKSYDDDVLDFIYKDMDTGKKYVETIKNPTYEVWIVKPEYRNYNHIQDFMDKSKCDCYRIHYKTRLAEIAKILGLQNKYDVKISPYVFQLDINIEHFYLMQFKHEYGSDNVKIPDIGFLDIETDMFQSVGKMVVGASPINCVSYLDAKTKKMYTLVLRKDDIPTISVTNKKYPIYEEMRKNYYAQVDYFIDHVKEFVEELHHDFDESYGVLDYHIIVFEDESKLLLALLHILRECSPDFWFVWNLPFDEESILLRLHYLGNDINEVIPDPDMRGLGRQVVFKGDNNPKAHKRRHISNVFTRSQPYDQLPLYAGIRVSKGSLQSMKLNQIAKIVLNDSKLDYSEYGDFKYFCYQDFWKFVKYNIKDVLLQYGIESLMKDSIFLMDVIANDCVLSHEIFTSTTTETMAIRDFAFYQCDKVMGNNKNKMDLPALTFSSRIVNEDGEEEADEYDEFMFEGEEDDDDDESDDAKKKKEKFDGAYVMSSAHISASGTIIMGKNNKYVHKHVVDMDIGSEYPSAILIMNCNNEYLVAKVFFLDPEDVKLPFCDNFRIIDAKDEETYRKIQSNTWVMELWSERDVLSFGETVLGLPKPSDILNDIGDMLEELA